MSYPLRKIKHEYENNELTYDKRCFKVIKKKRPKAKKKLLSVILSLTAISLYTYYICPYCYKNFLKPIFINKFLNRNIKVDFNRANLYPTASYLHNSFIEDEYIRTSPQKSSKAIKDIKIINEMTDTKNKLIEMFKNYPELKPSVFVWEYSTNSGLEIDANKVYPSASIIKVPIAYELIRLVDSTSKTPNPIKLSDNRLYSEFYKTEGSGDLKRTPTNRIYSLDYLANIMIANSDNSATNMILHEIGGVNGFNRSMRDLGLKTVSMSNWLPDLEGTNKISAKEISKILYNIDNPHYINPKYKNILKEYLGNTRNTHLIKEKLPPGTMVLHKTGDIESMLGDAGIVYTNSGKKYIVTILVQRPKNAHSAKKLIQDVSEIIFWDIEKI